MRSLRDKELRWDPGTKFAYSNMAFEVLGDLVAKVSGNDFREICRSKHSEADRHEVEHPVAEGGRPGPARNRSYQGKDGPVIPVAHYPYNRAHTPSSNLHSSATDMVRWMVVNLNRGELDGRRILKDSTYDLIWRPAAEASREALPRRDQLVPDGSVQEGRQVLWSITGAMSPCPLPADALVKK